MVCPITWGDHNEMKEHTLGSFLRPKFHPDRRGVGMGASKISKCGKICSLLPRGGNSMHRSTWNLARTAHHMFTYCRMPKFSPIYCEGGKSATEESPNIPNSVKFAACLRAGATDAPISVKFGTEDHNIGHYRGPNFRCYVMLYFVYTYATSEHATQP